MKITLRLPSVYKLAFLAGTSLALNLAIVSSVSAAGITYVVDSTGDGDGTDIGAYEFGAQ